MIWNRTPLLQAMAYFNATELQSPAITLVHASSPSRKPLKAALRRQAPGTGQPVWLVRSSRLRRKLPTCLHALASWETASKFGTHQSEEVVPLQSGFTTDKLTWKDEQGGSSALKTLKDSGLLDYDQVQPLR